MRARYRRRFRVFVQGVCVATMLGNAALVGVAAVGGDWAGVTVAFVGVLLASMALGVATRP